jgi:hypothetical protein
MWIAVIDWARGGLSRHRDSNGRLALGTLPHGGKGRVSPASSEVFGMVRHPFCFFYLDRLDDDSDNTIP